MEAHGRAGQLGTIEEGTYFDCVEIERGLFLKFVLQVGHLGPRLDELFADAQHVRLLARLGSSVAGSTPLHGLDYYSLASNRLYYIC